MNTCGSRHRTARSKVKTGCRTCKIRKVKCDEGRPACRRCVSTGRVCDGYGIWGGGGNHYGDRKQGSLVGCRGGGVVTKLLLPSPSNTAVSSILALNATDEERTYFDWFTCRTATKLPGTFDSEFWNKLILQASASEPAVLHAAVALSSIHKSGITGTSDDPGGLRRCGHCAPDEQERFALRHYVKATSHLQPHFLADRNRASCRVALIACLVFISLELLRGHCRTAEIHLQNGLGILKEMILSGGEKGSIDLRHRNFTGDPTDDWIVQAFSRLQLQCELYKPPSLQGPCFLVPRHPGRQGGNPVIVMFYNSNEAWLELERLFNAIFYLTQQTRREQQKLNPSLGPHIKLHSPQLVEQQGLLRTELARWLSKYEALGRRLSKVELHSSAAGKGIQLLRVYHTLADIMAQTCLKPGDEMVYDNCTEQFVLLLRQCSELRDISASSDPMPLVPVAPGRGVDMTRTVIDMGWIAPLYYAAVKCRVHRVRTRAVGLLESTSHREGIWDCKSAARAAWKVMELEERGFYKEFDTGHEVPLGSVPKPGELSALPPLPEKHRIRDVEVVLSGVPTDRLLIFGTREGGDERTCICEIDVKLSD